MLNSVAVIRGAKFGGSKGVSTRGGKRACNSNTGVIVPSVIKNKLSGKARGHECTVS